jgi:N-acyl-D-amino-acid deacylase
VAASAPLVESKVAVSGAMNQVKWIFLIGTLAAAAQLLDCTVRPAEQSPAFDLFIKAGRVVDGTGNPWFVADLAIKGDTVVAVGPHVAPNGARVIDATGLVVAPGFIDVHSHSEDVEQGLASNPRAENNVRQGVTTVFGNPDGFGEVPIRPFLERVAAARPAINLGAFIGHGGVRAKVMGEANRAATPAELAEMRLLVRSGMEDGAFGLSTGLFYVPGNYAPLEEVIDLAREAGKFGGIHQSHMRDEAAHVLDSVRETIAIGEQGQLPTQITHHKIIGTTNWGRSVDTLRLVDEARARGVDVTMDQYPYTASSTSIEAGLIPQWARAGGRNQMLSRLDDPTTSAKIRSEIMSIIQNERGGGDPANVVLARCDFDPALAGKNLAQVLRDRGRAVTLASAADLVIEIVRKGSCWGVFHAIGEDDLVRILRHPTTMIASDAFPGEPTFGRDVPHPRAYGTFARVLAVYVREQHVITLEEAIRKMSSAPAVRMRLTDRGLLRPGMKADIAVFDAATVKDLATFDHPHQYATGMHFVLVNGQIVLDDGKTTAARPGRVLYGPEHRPQP